MLLIDVRSVEERAAFHIGGEHIPMEDILKAGQSLPQNKAIVLYCRKGIRSSIAIQRLSMRYPQLDLYNLEHGIGE